MPLSKDPQGGGTNSDGSTSSEYCSKCYANGAFTHPRMTVGEMQKLVESKLTEMHFPKFIAKYFTKEIPHLRRWSGKAA